MNASCEFDHDHCCRVDVLLSVDDAEDETGEEGLGGERDERTARYGRRYSYREEGGVREEGTVNRNDVDGSIEEEEEEEEVEVEADDCPLPP